VVESEVAFAGLRWVGRAAVPMCRSFRGLPPGGRAIVPSGSPVTYAARFAVGCPAWMWSWQAAQTISVFRRRRAMTPRPRRLVRAGRLHFSEFADLVNLDLAAVPMVHTFLRSQVTSSLQGGAPP
jgi:hypothetical protein